jgi:hypothetical protein
VIAFFSDQINFLGSDTHGMEIFGISGNSTTNARMLNIQCVNDCTQCDLSFQRNKNSREWLVKSDSFPNNDSFLMNRSWYFQLREEMFTLDILMSMVRSCLESSEESGRIKGLTGISS